MNTATIKPAKGEFQSFNFFATFYNMLLIFFGANGIEIAIDAETWYNAFTGGQLLTALSLLLPTIISIVTKIIQKVKDGTVWNYTFLKGQNFLVQVGTLIAILLAVTGIEDSGISILVAGIMNFINFFIHLADSNKKKKAALQEAAA